MIKAIIKWGSNLLFTFVVLLMVIFSISNIQAKRNPGKIPSLFGYSKLTVLSSSMSPVFKAGDTIITKEIIGKDVKINDVITFKKPGNTSVYVTHRVVDIIETEDGLFFETMGDYTKVKDDELVPSENVVADYVFHIPYFGFVENFISSAPGLIIFLSIPVSYFLLVEVKKHMNKQKKVK